MTAKTDRNRCFRPIWVGSGAVDFWPGRPIFGSHKAVLLLLDALRAGAVAMLMTLLEQFG